MQGAAPPPSVRVQRTSDNALSAAWEPEGPGALQPSASPIPTPFPPSLSFRTVPKAGRVGECTPITFIMEGFLPADVVTSWTHGVRARFPLSSNGFTSAQLDGVPRSANGNPPVVPPNGLVNLTLGCAPSNPQASVGALPFTFDLRVDSWSSMCGSCGTQTIRLAVCGDPAGCTWTYLPAAEPSATPSTTSSPFPSDSPSTTPGVSPTPSATTFATLPHISAAGWAPLTTGECPPGLPWPCASPMVALTVAGDHFGATVGGVEYGALLPRVPAPPYQVRRF
jgi:hypothetical protein